jgi:tripartite-type tricarboxylate transporter receptor subunit TctC
MVSMETRPRRFSYLALVAVLLLLVAACSSDDEGGSGGGDEGGDAGGEADTSEAAEFYEGETLTLVVPFSPGGGYDTYTRMLAPYFEEYTGANVVVENQEGAGGLLAINELLTDRSEGLRISIMNAIGVGGAVIAGAEGPQFELDELSYIGRVAAEPHLMVVGADSEYETFEDVIDSEGFRFGSAGPGAADYVNPSVLSAVFGFDAEIVGGFAGSEETQLAVTRGDVDGQTGDFDSRIGLVEDGDHRGVLVLGEERRDELPDVPTIVEQDLDDDQQAMVDAHLALMALARPMVAPPNIPSDRLLFLRDAMGELMNDPDLIAESEEQGRPLSHLTGEEMDELVETLVQDAPDAYREVLTAAYEE